MKINKIFRNIILLSLITISIIYATSLLHPTHTFVKNTYQHMSITELQEEVEKLTQKGDLPFDMGLELMKRWTQYRDLKAI